MNLSPDTFPDKHPAIARVYGIDWTKDLPTGEVIASSAWAITGPDNTLTTSNPNNDGQKTSVWLNGGTKDKQYVVKNTIQTDAVPPKVLVAEKYINIRSKN